MCAYESRLINFKFAGLWILTARGLSEKFGSSPKKLVTKGMPGAIEAWKRWPRLQPHWPRIRRRICDQCGRRVALSKPRYLVCGGCGAARYCSEACQIANWGHHQTVCAALARQAARDGKASATAKAAPYKVRGVLNTFNWDAR